VCRGDDKGGAIEVGEAEVSTQHLMAFCQVVQCLAECIQRQVSVELHPVRLRVPGVEGIQLVVEQQHLLWI
jgi:hypothetical protein